nr:DNA ligase 3-like protein [Wadden Sea poxvirus]
MNECSFREFRKLCSKVSHESSYIKKTKLIKDFLSCYTNDQIYIIIKLLLPKFNNNVYNISDKQLIKLFGYIFKYDINIMLNDLENGYISETIKKSYLCSNTFLPIKKSIMSINYVYDFLCDLSNLTKYNERINVLEQVIKKSTANDIKCIVMLIKNDLQIKAGPKCILNSLNVNAYDHFKMCKNIDDVINNVFKNNIHLNIILMKPFEPMVAEPCKSIKKTITKFKDGLFSEIKYDGERIQIHKNGIKYAYFSRNLKHVIQNKIENFDIYINKAFPNNKNLILDSEIVLINTKSKEILPFGTLGINKRSEFKDVTTCLFIFDCMYINDNSLLHLPLIERRKILSDNIKTVDNKVLLSEMKIVHTENDINNMFDKVINNGLEGLMLKDITGKYEPGKRKWIKLKRNYINTISDTIDLVVLGSYYGKGSKGGSMSIFLMGCYNDHDNKWYTVTKCSGHDIQTLKKIQTELNMIKISKDSSKIPEWLIINKCYYPDFVVSDPKKSQVWEITGANFSTSKTHTANGISIRFPRFIKIRYDKDWKSSTNLTQLKEISKMKNK